MITSYRKAWEVIAYTYHADMYCVDCGESLPEVDPEGNDRHPVFVSDELVYVYECGGCGEVIQ